MNPPLILASTSRYRAELLSRLHLRFTTQAPHTEETPHPGESPRHCAARLALAKANAVAHTAAARGAWVIGSDQTASLDGQAIVGKPGSHEKARQQLRAASGQAMHFHTALCLVAPSGVPVVQTVVDTVVKFRRLDEHTIETYLLAERPYDCAGSAKSEGLGIRLIESMQCPDPTALVGLPLIALCDALLAAGFVMPESSPNLP